MHFCTSFRPNLRGRKYRKGVMINEVPVDEKGNQEAQEYCLSAFSCRKNGDQIYKASEQIPPLKYR